MGKFLSPVLLGLMCLLLWNSGLTAQAVREALQLCATAVVPSLFPFAVLSSLLVSQRGRPTALHRLFARVLGVSPQGVTVFFLGLLGGYPMGARLTGELVRQGDISPAEGAHLLRFVNNAGPAFVIGIAGATLGSAGAGVVLYLIHAATAALMAVLFRPRQPFPAAAHSATAARRTFVSAVENAAVTCLYITAFITFFSAFVPLLTALLPGFPVPLLGIVELTGGVTALGATAPGFVGAAALLGWGGVCVHCQTAAVVQGAGLPMAPYLRGKLLHALLSALAAYIVTNI